MNLLKKEVDNYNDIIKKMTESSTPIKERDLQELTDNYLENVTKIIKDNSEE